MAAGAFVRRAALRCLAVANGHCAGDMAIDWRCAPVRLLINPGDWTAGFALNNVLQYFMADIAKTV